jgi:peptidoglycan/xylan/chitin deacetylase (PgdA/CDA1 family)
MYHDVNSSGRDADIYSIPSDSFSRGVLAVAKWALDNDHHFVTFSAEPKPGIAVTFDDGYRSTLELAAPVFAGLEIPFHTFVTMSYVKSGDSRYLSEGDLKVLAEFPGATLGLHGTSHSRLSLLSDDSLQREISESRDWLEQLIGRTVNSLSYPHGDFDARVSTTARACGITAAACSRIGTFSETSQSLSIPRVDVWSYDSPQSTVAKTRGNWDFLLP